MREPRPSGLAPPTVTACSTVEHLLLVVVGGLRHLVGRGKAPAKTLHLLGGVGVDPPRAMGVSTCNCWIGSRPNTACTWDPVETWQKMIAKLMNLGLTSSS